MEILYNDAVRSHNFLIHHKVFGVPNLINAVGLNIKWKIPFFYIN